MTYDVGNLGPGMGKAQKYGEVTPVKGISACCIDCLIKMTSQLCNG